MQILNQIVNHAIQLDPDLMPQLTEFAGESLMIHLIDLNFKFYIVITDSGLNLTTETQEPTTTISGSSFNVLIMGFSSATDTVAAMQKQQIRIDGDVEFGMKLKRILSSMHIDWEEHLSKLTGDVVAHQIHQRIQQGRHWFESMHQRMQMNVKEYVQEEARISPTRIEFDDWLQQIAELRMATDRVEARFARLQARLKHD